MKAFFNIRFKYLILLLSVVVLLTHKGNSQVTNVNIPITKDTYINSQAATTNYGNQGFLSLYTEVISFVQHRRYMLLEPDLSTIPANAIILSASVNLYCYEAENYNFGTGGISFRRNSISWNETNVTWNSHLVAQPFLFDEIVFTPDVTVGWKSYNVVDHVQKFVTDPSNNNGWFVLIGGSFAPPEFLMEFYSSEFPLFAPSNFPLGNPEDFVPYIQVEYILPIEVSGGINHTEEGESNGSINATAEFGTGTYVNYQWFEGSTGNSIGSNSPSITGLDVGWYGLLVTDDGGNTGTKIFVVGEQCNTKTITIKPNGVFGKDIFFLEEDPDENYPDVDSLGVSFIPDFPNPFEYIPYKSLIEFNPEFGSLALVQANFKGYYKETPSLGSSLRLVRIDPQDNWKENNLSSANFPSTIPGVTYELGSSVEGDVTAEYAPTGRFSFLIDNGDCIPDPPFYNCEFIDNQIRQVIYSSDASNASFHPELIVTVSAESSCQSYYAELKNLPDGNPTLLLGNTLRFYFDERYPPESEQKIIYRIINEDLQVDLGVDKTGTPLVSGSPEPKINFNKNAISIDVSSLTPGFYLLEVTTNKNIKKYLKFKKLY